MDVDAAIAIGGRACTATGNGGNKDAAIGNSGTQPKPPVRMAGQAE